MINNFNATFEGTYVCRTMNIAGVDADVVSLVTGKSYITKCLVVIVLSWDEMFAKGIEV